MSIVRRAARELTGADGATFVLRERDQCHYADEDSISPLWKGQRFPLTACISGWVMLNAESAVIEDIYADPRILPDAYRPTFVKSLAMVPVGTPKPIAAIGTYWATQRVPTAEDLDLLQALAKTTAIAMENVALFSTLERQINERTLQWQATNQELESFSYSVSHDLKAPLRRMAGFSQILLDECGPRLESEERNYLERICKEGKNAGKLVDDLLRLAKLSRASLRHERVNLTSLAEEAVARLGPSSGDPQPVVTIEKDLLVYADSGLLQIALENLLSNALKFSSKCSNPKIEVGSCIQTDGTVAVYVRDNGVGFEMTHASRLFRPFERLHSETEFAGAGMGLANVQRIIHKHGGRIWAEGALGHGATFFFTLPSPKAC
jgi:signal transduction histidine kinase